MRCWATTVSEDRFAGERLYAFDTLTLPDTGTSGDATARRNGGPRPGDLVALLVTGEPPSLFGLGRVREPSEHDQVSGVNLAITYTHRLFDQPMPVVDHLVADLSVADLLLDGSAQVELDPDQYALLADRVEARAGTERATAGRSEWFVSVALPIEAVSRAEAVREFWTHMAKLGPRELPAYVWPRNDELAMRAFLLGEETNLDPEED